LILLTCSYHVYTLNISYILSSQVQELQQMQQKIDVLTKEKEEFLKQKENPEKGYLFYSFHVLSIYVHVL
jgi:hypothetical protein